MSSPAAIIIVLILIAFLVSISCMYRFQHKLPQAVRDNKVIKLTFGAICKIIGASDGQNLQGRTIIGINKNKGDDESPSLEP